MTTLAGGFTAKFDARKVRARLFGWGCAAMAAVAALLLLVLLARVISQGWSAVSWNFVTHGPNLLEPEAAGVRPALWGTLWLMGLTTLACVPIGVGAAIYLEEYNRRTRLARLIEVNIANLAGVPSVVYGILGLTVFIRGMRLGESVLAGALSLSLLILPTVIIAAREALRAVPQSIRQASYALGATRWQTIRHHVLPAAIPGVTTGVILGLARAIGEAAPLIMIGAVIYINFIPKGPLSAFTALPLQIYDWSLQPDPIYVRLTAGAIIVLLAVFLPLNVLAVLIRSLGPRRR